MNTSRKVRAGASWLVVLPAAMMLVPASRAEILPTPGMRDMRIRTAHYNAEEVYRLHGFVGYEIELEFEPGETFAGRGGGDLEGVTFGSHEHYVVLKPKAANVGTNLVIYTNRRAYRFDYTVSSSRPNPLTDEVMYTVRFIYPPPLPTAKALEPTPAERVEQELAQARVERPRNVDYWFCGHPAVKPVAASDDGVHTRLTFGVKAEIPAMFVRNDDGTESLLNFHIEEGDVFVHRTARTFVLRRGKLTGCIVNKGFSGSGERLQSGTVAPDVKRERKELRQ